MGGYIRTSFTVEDGLSSNVVNAILQTRNGFLWLGTDAGLDRFNGSHFTPIYFRGPRSTPQGIVRSLAEGPDGDLWIGTSAGLARIAGAAWGDFDRSQSVFYHPGPGYSDDISRLAFGCDGTLWVGTSAGLYRFRDNRFENVIPRVSVDRMEQTADCHLLVATRERLVELDGTRVVEHPGLADQLGVRPDQLYHVFQDRQGTLWFSSSAGLARRAKGPMSRFQPYGGEANTHAVFGAYQDPQGTVWVWSGTGLFRASATRLELFASNIQVRSIYGDRENNLWAGTNGEGLTRFKDRPIRMFTRADGLPNNIPMAVLARRDGSLWVGNNCGGLSVFDGKRFKTYDEKNGLLNSCVWSLAEGADGELWVGTWGGGLFRFEDDRFVQFATPQGLAGDVVRTIAVSRDGSLWVATEGGLSHMRNGHFRNYTTIDGLSSDRVVSVYEDRRGEIWVGTSRGIEHLIGDRFVPVSSARQIFDPRYINIGEDSFGNVYALSAPKGIDRIQGDRLVNVNHDLDVLSMAPFQRDMWFSGGNGVFRIPAAVLQQSDRAGDTPLDYASFGRADGMNSAQCSIGTPNIAITADGKFWVATVQGLAMFDPRQSSNDFRKPPIFVEAVTVGRTTQPAGRELVLAPGTHHVELHFDSISLAWPEKIRFQYRMDDVDPVWLDADNLRTAVYTKIPLGSHAFRLRACNSSGAWDLSGISFAVIQKPYFYETNWFRLFVATSLVLILAGGYRVRLWQISAQMQARLDERLLERTRVARELHDTLLQSIQASKLMAGSALQDPSDAANMHGALEKVSLWLEQAVKEAREALSSLRTSTTQRNDLADALRHAGDECCQGAMSHVLTVQGVAREMHPIIRDEAYRIGYEAIRNAATHSGGSRLDIELSYVRDLILRVRDNGRGIDPVVLDKGKEGHFGIKGIRERAERIRARLSFKSTSAGTEVELIVPGHLAFLHKHQADPSSLARLRRYFRLIN